MVRLALSGLPRLAVLAARLYPHLRMMCFLMLRLVQSLAQSRLATLVLGQSIARALLEHWQVLLRLQCQAV
jgi:hypothetical protein